MSEQPKASQKNNPLHGLTLEAIVTALLEYYGWEELGAADQYPLLHP